MSTRSLTLAALSAALLAIAGFSGAVAQESKPHMHMDSPGASIDHMVEMAKTKADHEAIAKRFDDEAADLDKQAAEHEKLARRYRGGMGVGPKTNAESLANHCDSFVKNLRASSRDAREMARMHRDVAQQLAK